MQTNIFDPFSELWQKLVNGGIPSGGTVVKVIAMVFLVFYLFYALLIIRQVSLMNQFLETKLSPWTKVIAYIYFLYTLFITISVLLF